MRKLVCSALALTAAVTPALASESDWLSLDSELEALPGLLDSHEGPKVSGYIKATYRHTDLGDLEDAAGNDTLADFDVEKARVAVSGDLGDTGYSYKVQADFASGFNLKDAWVQFPISGDIKGKVGHFKAPFLRSGLISSSRLFFNDRSLNGALWGGRDFGVQVNGSVEQFRWYVAVFNGTDAGLDEDDDPVPVENADDYRFVARAEFDVLGEKPAKHEGAQGGSEDPSLTAAVAWTDDGALDDGDAIAFEAVMSTNVYSFAAELVDYGKDGSATGGLPGSLGGVGGAVADATPFSIMGTWMLSPDEWEVGLRYDDFDDDGDTNLITVGVTRYLLEAHKLKYTIQYAIASTDEDDLDDISQISLGIVASF